MQILAVTGSVRQLELTYLEKQIVSLLKTRPHSLDELVQKTGVFSDGSLPLERLEENFILQRAA